jgi:hypothetical protein
MTIAIALAVIAVLAVAGVWLLRRQAAEQREGGARPHIEDGPPPSTDDRAAEGPLPEAPWLHRPAPESTAVPEEPIPSAAPDAVPEPDAVPFASPRTP